MRDSTAANKHLICDVLYFFIIEVRNNAVYIYIKFQIFSMYFFSLLGRKKASATWHFRGFCGALHEIEYIYIYMKNIFYGRALGQHISLQI